MRQVRHLPIIHTIRQQQAMRSLQLGLLCSHHRREEDSPWHRSWIMDSGADNKHQIDMARCPRRDLLKTVLTLRASLRHCSQGQDSRQILFAMALHLCSIYTRQLHYKALGHISRLQSTSGIKNSIDKLMTEFHQGQTASQLGLRYRLKKLDRESMRLLSIPDRHFINFHSLRGARISDR
jgi:hypothetical protein